MWQRIWACAWYSTTTTLPLFLVLINFINDNDPANYPTTFMHHSCPCSCMFFRNRASFGSFMPTLLPLCSCWSSAISKHSSRTNTGCRCSIFYCIDLIPGFYVTQSSHCSQGFWFHSDSFRNACILSLPSKLGTGSLVHSPPSTSCFVSLSHSQLYPMPHLHQRMRCHRGSSCGCPPRHPPSTSLSSSSPPSDSPLDHYPKTRSGHGF